MIDHSVSKFFETLFWIGAFLIIISFFYPRWFMVTILIGALLMVIATVREGFRLRRAKTFVGLVKKNEPQVVHRIVLMVGVILVFVYLLLKQTMVYNLIIQIYDLTGSPAIITWWVFVLLGIIIGLTILFIAVKMIAVKYGGILEWIKSKYPKIKLKKKIQTKEKKVIAKKVLAEEKPGLFSKLFWEEKRFWEKILTPLFKKLETRKAKKIEKEKTRLEELRKKKIEELKKKVKEEKILIKEEVKKHPLLPRALILLFIFAITTILVLHKKGKFSIEDPISAAALGATVGLFTLYIIINIYKVSKEKRVKEEKQEKKVLQMIKEEVIAKASKYETDVDKLYKLINEVGCLTLTEVAEGFSISKEQAEEWGKMLESHGLIELNYPAVGELQLCKKKSKSTE